MRLRHGCAFEQTGLIIKIISPFQPLFVDAKQLSEKAFDDRISPAF
jgi:hypothetical protein